MSSKIIHLLSKSFNLVPANGKCMSYKSALSLDKLYPKSTEVKAFKPPESTDGKFTVLANGKCMFYNSALSLDKLYPKSTEVKAFKLPESTDGKFTGYIPIKELVITSMMASGPGGQHVNKTETKVDVRFHVESATWLSEETKKKLIDKHYTRINKEGYFIVRSEKTRSKILNQADALNYIRQIIFKLEEPKPELSPETLEKIRKNKEKAARMRLMEKRTRSLMKSYRQCDDF